MPAAVFKSVLEVEEAYEQTVPVVVTPAAAGFQMRADEQELGDGISIADIRAVPLRARTRSRVVRPARDLLLFCVHVSGPARVIQHDRAADVGPGAGVLYETRTPFELVYPAEMNSVSLQVPRELVPIRTAQITGYSARTLSAQSPAMRDVLVRMMCQHVRDHVGDRHLSVAELARRHHVSERHVHTPFERIGTTPGGYIRAQRLLAARAMLANPANDACPVADIGAAAGFTDPRAFERAFRRQYEMTPGRWRRAHRAGGHTSEMSA
jgi:AraC-like DNA-binding protein